ncbi:hypothetical protein AA313_de0201786 [Arthrobotrys entomopaga]|nr:hypothetical protein AA313_de0201786 [Arthrobotrys entomopaga]
MHIKTQTCGIMSFFCLLFFLFFIPSARTWGPIPTRDIEMCDKSINQERNTDNATSFQCGSPVEIYIPRNVDITVELPFDVDATKKFPEDGPPQVLMTINGVSAGGVQMDTGSTAITIGKATWIDDFNGNWDEVITHSKGWKFLSSSKVLYSGYWVPTDLIFHSKDSNGNLVDALKSTVPVLVYDVVSHCPGFTNEQQGDCASPTSTKSGMSVRGLYMGVGFGREQDGMLECTPDKNPLLNVYEVNGKSIVGSSNYRLGYIIKPNSLIWGLTATNIQDYKFTALTKQQPTNGKYDWAMATMVVSVNGGPYREGQLLADTGVTKMFLSSPDVPNPISASYSIDFKIPNLSGFLGGYTVTALRKDGNKTATSSIPGTEPLYVGATYTKGIVSGPAPGVLDRVYLNTGSRFFHSYEAAFDAEGGNWGTKLIPG